jgi:hypothetical protein
MATSSEAYKELVNNSQVFSKVATDLHEVLPNMKIMTETLFTQSKSLSEVLNTMKDVTPQFESKVNLMLTELDSGISKLIAHVSSKIEEEITQSVNLMSSNYSTIAASHVDSAKNFTSTIQGSTAELKQLLSETVRDNQKILTAGLEDSLAKIRDGVTTLDKGLEKELTRSLESLSHQLASLSAKFVEDYTPLTERLREIVRLSSTLKG